MADTTIDVLNLSKVEALEDGDALLLIRTEGSTQTAKRIDGAQFKGADGEAYNVEDITAAMKRNRLTITF